VSEAQGGQRRNAAHYHCIVHLKRAGFRAQLPRSWRTADQELDAVELRPAERPKKTLTDQKNARGSKKRAGQQTTSKNAKTRYVIQIILPWFQHDLSQTLDLFGDVK
jgi:hypothetical protein